MIRSGQRPFKTVEEMDRVCIQNWNCRVGSDDDIYILGDFSMRGPHYALEILKQLNGRKHLVRGNHDQFVDRGPLLTKVPLYGSRIITSCSSKDGRSSSFITRLRNGTNPTMGPFICTDTSTTKHSTMLKMQSVDSCAMTWGWMQTGWLLSASRRSLYFLDCHWRKS